MLALLAAVIVAFGEVVQQRMAAQAPPQDNLSPRLLLWLVQRPRWLAGVACSLAGNLAFAAAVARGSVVVVEAVFVTRLLFGLVMSALWGWHRIPLRDLLGGAGIVAGLAAFLLALQPRVHVGVVPDLRWAYGAGVPMLLAIGLALLARPRTGTTRALLLGIGAGILFGLQAALVQMALHVLTDHGVAGLLQVWQGYAVVVVALTGMLLVQSAFESAPLSSSYPGAVSAQLLCAIAIGLLVLHGRMNDEPGNLVAGLLGLLTMVGGIVIVTTSHLLTHGERHPGLPEPSVGSTDRDQR